MPDRRRRSCGQQMYLGELLPESSEPVDLSVNWAAHCYIIATVYIRNFLWNRHCRRHWGILGPSDKKPHGPTYTTELGLAFDSGGLRWLLRVSYVTYDCKRKTGFCISRLHSLCLETTSRINRLDRPQLYAHPIVYVIPPSEWLSWEPSFLSFRTIVQ